MATTLRIDDALLNEAVELGGFGTAREAVIAALTEFVAKHRQRQILELEGAFDFDPDYDDKALRQRV